MNSNLATDDRVGKRASAEGENVMRFAMVGRFLRLPGPSFSSVPPSRIWVSPIFTPGCMLREKGDTLSTMLMLIGFALFVDDFSLSSWLLFVKIMGVVLFIFISTPTSSHALMRAALKMTRCP